MNAEDKPSVWIISRQHWPRALLRAELIGRGYQAVGFFSMADALQTLGLLQLDRPALIVVELRDLEYTPDDLAALEIAGIPVILLGGAIELANPAVSERTWDAVIARPFTIGVVADRVEKFCQV